METNPLLSPAFSSKHNQILSRPRQYHLPANSQMDEEAKMNQASQRCLTVPDFQRFGPLQGPPFFVLPVRKDFLLVPGFHFPHLFILALFMGRLWSRLPRHFQYMPRKFYAPQSNFLFFFFLSSQSRPFNSFLDYNPRSTEAAPPLSHHLLEFFMPEHLVWGTLPRRLLHCGGVPLGSEAAFSLGPSLLQC